MKKKSSSQASWSILSEGVSASRVEAHIVRSHVNQMIDAIKENPQLAEEIFKRCGDNFEAIPKHLSKMERSLDRTNYALITMGSDWYRQRLTHEDREMVDMASKYNPTPFPSTSKQSGNDMYRQAKTKFEVDKWVEDRLYDDFGFSEVKVLSVKEDKEDKDSLYALVHCGINNKWAIIYQDDEGDQEVDTTLLDERRTRATFDRETTGREMVAKYNPTPFPSTSKQSEFDMRKQAGFGRIIADAIDQHANKLERLDPEFIDGGVSDFAQEKQEALYSGDFDLAMSMTRNRRVKDVIMAIQHSVDTYGRRASKSAAPKGTPTGVWEDFGDNRKLINVRSVPSATNRNDQEKGDFSFDELKYEFVDAIAAKRSDIMGIHKKLDTGLMEIYLFKIKASYTETVEVSSGYPDGGATFYLWEVYFRPTQSKTLLFKANLRVESLVVAGGSFVEGTLLTESKAKNFISAAKRNHGTVY